MFIKKNNRKRVIAFLLSLVMIMTMLPMSAYAVEKSAVSSETEAQNYITNNTYKGTEEDNPILEEETLLRDEFTKHYIDADGNRYAVVFPEQVHYSENDSWIEIDNTFSLDETTKRYVSRNEKFRTQFSQESDSNQLVTIEDGEYKLSWSISFASGVETGKEQGSLTMSENTNVQKISKVSALVSEVSEAAVSKVKNKETISELGKAISGISYNGVLGDKVDLRYSVLHGKVEEDVILNSPEGFTSYMLTVDTNGLNAVKCEDNSVAFVTAEGETIFTLGAPWMKDSYVSVSDDIEVTVRQKDDVAYIIYAPNLEWLNDESRVYPVLIDPSFKTRFYTSNYEDTYVYTGDSASSTRPTETTMKVGNLSGKQYYAYVKILNIPDMVGGFGADEAILNFWVTTTSSPSLSVYEVNGDWAPNTITYANQPSASLIKSNQVGEASGSVSKYSVDLTDWLDYISYEYYSLSDYFNSDDWNGFKIGYTTNTTGNYTQICASEYATASYRPVITFTYNYWPYGGIEDDAVYSFVNSASNKYLTVDSTNMSTGNVYQYTKNYSLSQAFRLDYNETNDCYRIRTMCSEDGYGSVLEVPSYSGTINSSTGYTNSNVRVHSYSSSWADDQDWIVYPYNYSDLYMIVLRSDPNLALTAYGTSNGSASGTTSTSAGNVYVSQFTGASNQLWKLESGGIQLINATNIKEVSAEGETYAISEGRTWQSFCCPVNEYGAYVSWWSSNTQSATVDSVGHVTTGTAGIATIYAEIEYEDGSYDTYSCTIYVIVDNGTYYFNNVSNNYRLEYESTTNLSENAVLEAYNSGTGEPTGRFRMFKVKYLGDGIYSVRSMLDCGMGWTRSSSSLVMTTIGPDDSAIPSTAKWRIKSNANGYYIHSLYGTSKTITAGSTSGANITLSSYSSTNRLQNWTMNEITESYHGVTLKNTTNKLVVGDTFDFDAVMYSTYTNTNGEDGFTWSVTNGTGSATINSSTGVLTGTSVGTVTVKVKYKPNSYQEWVSECVVNIIPISEGTYFFENKDTSKYMQPDDGGESHMEQHDFDASQNQRWRLVHNSDSYYYIINDATNKYLTAPDSNSSGKSITEESYNSSIQSRQLWAISEISGRNSYKIQSKNQIGGNLVLAVGWGANWNGINIEQRNFDLDNNYKDEWLLTRIQYTVNLDVVYDNAYSNRYGNAYARINDQISTLQKKYLREFGITVNVNLSMFSSYADLNCTTSHTTECNHATNSLCKNSVLYTDGSTTLETYHHTNIYNIMLRIPFPNLASSVKVAYIGHEYCTEDNHSSQPYYGLTYESIGLATIMNFDSVKSETKTFIHEFGHLYGIIDHYGGSAMTTDQIIAETGNTGYNRNCIYGENKETSSVLSDYTICDGCKSIVKANIDRYDH